MSSKRPPVRIKFKYNLENGEVEEFIIDDNAYSENEDYHNTMAKLIAGKLSKNIDISDAGPKSSDSEQSFYNAEYDEKNSKAEKNRQLQVE